jgi:oligoribonuclease NrnB/cAMP/cGMP phosphodiesterase (DHH superfamily)
MIVIHHADLDGRCAAAIVSRYFGGKGITFHATDYKDSVPLGKLAGEDVVIVDFSYKPNDMLKIIELANSVVWIDHHATAKDYPYQYLTGLRNFEDKRYAGCELTWMYYFPTERMPRSVCLIGDYDKWALRIEASKAFYEGMRLEKNGPEEYIWPELLDGAYFKKIQDVIANGKIAMMYRDNYCNDLCRSFGYETEIDGYKAYACNQSMFGSGGFGHRFDQYPLCIAYIHDGERFTVSLYSKEINVGEIAKAHGGGGHKGAAGFTCETLPFIKL